MVTFSRKQGLFLLLLLLTGCTSAVFPTATPTARPAAVTPTAYRTPPIVAATAPVNMFLQKAFTLNNQCLRLCWLEISPGVTSIRKAYNLLQTSNQIKLDDVNAAYTQATWLNFFYISIYPEKDIVQSIVFNRLELSSVTVRDVFRFLGEPTQIRLGKHSSPHCDRLVYLLYYLSTKTVIKIPNATWNGPEPDDWIDAIILNTEFDASFVQSQLFPIEYKNELSEPQPWLGYEHIHEYFPKMTGIPQNSCWLPSSTP